MAADELECSQSQVDQAVSIMGQLDTLRTTCEESGNVIGNICCQIATTALSVIIARGNPPKRWGTATKEEQDV